MQLRQPAPVIAAIEQAGGEPNAVRGGLLQSRKHFCRGGRVEAMRQRQHQKLAFGKFQEIPKFQEALALLAFSVSLPRLPRVSSRHSRP